MNGLHYYVATYHWHSRPGYPRKGREREAEVIFAARDLAEAYRLAEEEGYKKYYRRHKWSVTVRAR